MVVTLIVDLKSLVHFVNELSKLKENGLSIAHVQQTAELLNPFLSWLDDCFLHAYLL